MKIRKLLPALLCCALFLGILSPSVHAGGISVCAVEQAPESGGTETYEEEPNNDCASANPLASAQIAYGQLNADADTYRLTVEKAGLLEAALYITDGTASCVLLDENGEMLTRSMEAEPSGEDMFRMVLLYFVDAPGTYYIQLENKSGSAGYGLYHFMAGYTDRYEDVEHGQYYENAVNWADTVGITTGVDETHFAPDAICTREQLVCMLWRYFGSPAPDAAENPFMDVDPDAYYYDAVCWAAQTGMTDGVAPDTFGVGRSCTRAQMAGLLWKVFGRQKPECTDAPFTDVPEEAYYRDAVLWTWEHGVMNGLSATCFAPVDLCTRAQAVMILYRWNPNLQAER